MKYFYWFVGCIWIVFGTLGAASAQQIEKVGGCGKFDLRPGDEFEYLDDGKDQTMVFEGVKEGQYRFKVNADRQAVFSNCMSTVAFGATEFSPSEGFTNSKMIEVREWKQSVIRKDNGQVQYTRNRSCTYKGNVKVNVKAGTFDTHLVECTSQRDDRQSSREEKFWLDVRTGMLVKRKHDWWGSSPGEYNKELKAIKLISR